MTRKLNHRSSSAERRPLAGWVVLLEACLLSVMGAALSLGQASASPQDPKPKEEPGSASPAASSSPAVVSPDSKTSPNQSTQIRVRVEVVNVPVTVLDKRGRPVIDLTKDDFEVYEDGVKQQIRYFYRGTRPPLRIGLILDTSNSARRALQFEKDAASEFVFNILQGRNSKHQVYLQTYDETSSVIQDFSNDPEVLNEKIRALKAGGGKALFDAIYFACREKMLKTGPPAEMRRVLVVVSDGRDIHSQHTLEEALSMAHRAETVLYTIGNTAFGYANPGDKVLARLAEDSGGAALFPLAETPGTDLGTGYLSHGQIGDTSQNKGLGAETGIYSARRLMQLADSLDNISRELNDQYSLGYTPKNNLIDGTYRTIRVVALRKDLKLRSKPGYFALSE